MIDYRYFQFACPPRCGGTWFRRACIMAGLDCDTPPDEYEYTPFPPDNLGMLRVTLVRRPWDWLISYYASLVSGASRIRPGAVLPQFSELPVNGLQGFEAWVTAYLQTMPGTVGSLYRQYRATAVQRVEDQPWAFRELVDALGRPPVSVNALERLSRPVDRFSIYRSERLERQVRESESWVYSEYDY